MSFIWELRIVSEHFYSIFLLRLFLLATGFSTLFFPELLQDCAIAAENYHLKTRKSISMFGVSYEERGRDPHIYVQSTTLNCAIVKACVPCLYKLFPDGKEDKLLMDVLSTTHSLCFPCNQRPELCPRSKLTEQQMNQLGIYDQAGEDEQRLQILTVGDGDFSFSLSLASHVLKEAGNTTSLTATSHESLKSVLDTYHPHSKDTLAKLKSFGATVLHGVDATNLAATSELRSKSSTTLVEEESEPAGEKVKMKRFDFVIWNFPCLSLPAGADGQATELQANQELLSKFFSNVHALLNKHTGEVHISHKTVEPFSWWGIKKLAKDNGFDFAYAIVFDRYTLHNDYDHIDLLIFVF